MTARSILFLAEGQLGDLLLLTPAIRGMKEAFPDARLSVFIVERRGGASIDPSSPVLGPLPQGANSVLAGNPHIDQLFTLNRDALRLLPFAERLRAEFSLVRFLRRSNHDIVISTFPEDRFALWSFASGATLRVGQDDQGMRRLLNVRPKIRKGDGGVLQYYCDLVRACGASCASTRTEYRVGDEMRKWAEAALSDAGLAGENTLIAVHPGASGDYKIWPPERFAELIDLLQADHAKVILCYGPLDGAIADAIRSRARSAIAALDTGGHVGRLAALLERSALCISNDSGPRHLAVAVGVRTLAIFRTHHDREWLAYERTDRCMTLNSNTRCPVCPPDACLDRIPDGERFGAHCIRLIPVADVYATVRRMLR